MKRQLKKLNRKIKNLEIYQIRNLIVIGICLFFVMSLSVGYAILSQTLKIDGEVSIRAKKDIRITKIDNFTSTAGGYDVYNPTYNTNSITANISLPELASAVTYTITIQNNGTMAVDVLDIQSMISKDDVVYILSGIKVGDVIPAKATITLTVTFQYAESATLAEDSKVGATINFSFIEHTETENEKTIKAYALKYQLADIKGSLYQDNIGNYTYRGEDPNNYLKFAGSDSLYRIIHYSEDNTMKIINITDHYNGSYDASGNRSSATSTYCDKISLENYGCNAWNSSQQFSNGTVTGIVENNATITNYLNETYYSTLEKSLQQRIITHKFASGIGAINQGRDVQNTNSLTETWSGKVATLSLADVVNASVESVTIVSGKTTISNYLTKLADANVIYWTMTASPENTYDVFVVDSTSSINQIGANATRESVQINKDFYAAPCFYISSETTYSGTGTRSDPFLIS